MKFLSKSVMTKSASGATSRPADDLPHRAEVPGVEQQPARRREGPLELHAWGRREMVVPRGFRRQRAGALSLVTLAVVFVAEQHGDLVLGRRLPRQTKRFIDVEVVLVARPAEILRVEQACPADSGAC